MHFILLLSFKKLVHMQPSIIFLFVYSLYYHIFLISYSEFTTCTVKKEEEDKKKKNSNNKDYNNLNISFKLKLKKKTKHLRILNSR